MGSPETVDPCSSTSFKKFHAFQVTDAESRRHQNIMPRDQGESFSKRHGFQQDNPPITVWEDAPEDFRHAVLQVAKQTCELSPHELREITCKVLRKRPDPSNWSPYPNVWDEMEWLVEQCPWFKVYDIIEAIWEHLKDKVVSIKGNYVHAQTVFEAEISELMIEFGIGWKLEQGLVQARGEESYETYLRTAESSLEESGRKTALTELKEAIRDVSRRPEPDTSGAIQHAMAALECVVRDIANDPKPTLGKLMQRHPDLFPKPVDDAVEKLWGYASENARHGREGNDPTREEAMLVVGVAATMTNYLIHKFGS